MKEEISVINRRDEEGQSRHRLQQLKLALAAGSVGTWCWDIRTNEVKVSSEGCRLYGLAAGIRISTYAEWERNIYPPDVTSTRAVLKRSVENRIPLDVEFRIVWPDGSMHWLLAKANTIYDDAGKPERMVGVNIDVTRRRNAIQALEESEKRFHTMSDSAPVMIWMADTGKRVVFLNKRWLSFTGRRSEQEMGTGWLDGIHPDDYALFVDVYNRSFEERTEFRIDYRIRRRDGVYRWVMTHGIPRFTRDNDFLGFIGTCVDINDRIDLERQKDDFMSIASHELKTPVTSIKAYAQILREKFSMTDDAMSSHMLARLDMQIDKLTGLINTLLDVARLQSGRMDYAEEQFEVREFVQDIVEDMQRACPTHTLVSVINADGYVRGDKARIGQVLSNLLSNATKYSPNADKVIVQVDLRDDHYIFTVQDFGVGIRPDMQEKVFGRFFRVTEGSGGRASGLGLGLFISAQIVKQHGGKLWVESRPGEGSRFFFSLPPALTPAQIATP